MLSIRSTNHETEVLLRAADIRFSHLSEDGNQSFNLIVEQLEIYAGEVLALCGASGSGKTTLMSILSGTRRPSSGQVIIAAGDGARDLYNCTRKQGRRLRRELGIVYQDVRESLNDRRTVLDSIIDPLRIHRLPGRNRHGILDRISDVLGLCDPSQRAMGLDILRQVSISPDLAMRRPQNLSGGQRQRAAIARALIHHPQLLFLDEPTSALDVSVQASVIALLQSLHRRFSRVAFVFVTHDIALARQIASRIAVLDQGRIVEIGTPTKLLRSANAPATKQLISAVQWEQTRAALQNDIVE